MSEAATRILGPVGPPLLLASASAARRRLLEAAGLAVDVEPSGVDEAPLQSSGGSPEAVAAALARAKALAVSERRPDRVVIGADQTLELDGRLFTKAADAAEAREALAALAGRTHALHSAIAVARGGTVEAAFLETARMTMRPLGREAIARYVDAAGPAATRSVGGYEIEGLGIHLFERIEGEHSTILGLPLLPLLAALRKLRLEPF